MTSIDNTPMAVGTLLHGHPFKTVILNIMWYLDWTSKDKLSWFSLLPHENCWVSHVLLLTIMTFNRLHHSSTSSRLSRVGCWSRSWSGACSRDRGGLSAVTEWRRMKCCCWFSPLHRRSISSTIRIPRWLQRTLLHTRRNPRSGLFVWIRGKKKIYIYLSLRTPTHFRPPCEPRMTG